MIGRNSGSSAHKHKIFVDNIAEVESFDPTSRMKSSTPSSSALTKASFEQLPPEIATKSAKKAKKILTKVVEKKMKNSYKELEQRQQRAKQLGTALHALSLQRHLLGKGSKRKVVLETNRAGDEEDGEESDGKKVVFKWKRERQK